MKKILPYLIAIIAHVLKLTAPIHELGHVLCANMLNITAKMTWRTTTYFGRVSSGERIMLAWAGVTFETVVFGMLAWLFWRAGKRWAGAFCTGHAMLTFSTAGLYTDIYSINYTGVGLWYLIGTAVLLYLLLNKRKAERAGYSGRVV